MSLSASNGVTGESVDYFSREHQLRSIDDIPQAKSLKPLGLFSLIVSGRNLLIIDSI